jgi:hypothetical protein
MKESEKIKAELDAANKEWLVMNKRINDLGCMLADTVAAEIGLNVGDAFRVMQYGKTEHGIYAWSNMYYDEVRHFFHRIKADGTASKNTFHAGPTAIIEKA